MQDWQSYLKPTEREVMLEVEAWAQQPQGFLGRAITFAGRPFDYAFGLVPAALKESLGQAVYGALSTLRHTASYTVSRQAILDRISAGVGLDVGSELSQIFRADVRQLDRFARGCLDFNRRAAAVQGGAAGAAGLLGFVGDVPALYTLLYRCVQEIAICYGFPVDSEAEEAHMLKILDVGHFLEDDRRRAGLQELVSLQDQLRAGVPIQGLERFAVAKTLEAIARNLAGALARRKAAQAVAVVGSVVGAGVNYQLVSDVGTVAFQAYRHRFVVEVAHRRMRRDLATRPLEVPAEQAESAWAQGEPEPRAVEAEPAAPEEPESESLLVEAEPAAPEEPEPRAGDGS